MLRLPSFFAIALLGTLFTFLIAPALWASHGGTIKGVVVAASDNELLTGATVRIEGLALVTCTNEIGGFAFPDIENGSYAVLVSLIGYAEQRVMTTVANHETTTLCIVLQEKALDLGDVEISVQQYDPLQSIRQLDIALRPIQSSQDILRNVPGLFIAQHAGGGKAEQIFLRGFDIDHGTDIAIFTDGIPVNMVSHAHGQGYADLHYAIPELLQNVDFQKGMYDARVGNFATAGQVQFNTPNALGQNMLKVEGGQYDTYRAVAAFDLLGEQAAGRGNSAYVATEQLFSNGYFEAQQQLRRQNYFAKFHHSPDEHQSFSASFSEFSSAWLASGQVPERAVQSGLIGRFGAIDNTEGGSTGRRNANLIHLFALNDHWLLRNQLYASQYRFELYSNFTFFLNDPVNGDQIRQKEKRIMTGLRSSAQYNARWADRPVRAEGGLQLRSDAVRNNELSTTRNRRTTLQRLAYGDVQETNSAAFATFEMELLPGFSANAGLRFDHFQYAYINHLDSVFAQIATTRSQASPKLSLQWQATRAVQVYLRMGRGFHSNDTRTVVNGRTENILPAAWGCDMGLQLRPFSRLLLGLTGWQLDLEQEFVYVGDAGVVEPGGRTRRIGLDVSARWQALPYLFVDADYTYTHARVVDEPEGQQFVALAPKHTGTGGVNIQSSQWKGSLRMRYLGDRPANADNSLQAAGYCLFDAQIAYLPLFKNDKQPLEISISVQNIANTAWKETQFETETRLRDEQAPVTEIHFTPGSPFWAKAGVVLRF